MLFREGVSCRILYYHTSHKFAMLKLHWPEGENSYYHTSHESPMLNFHRTEVENSYYHPAIISTITCAALMRVQFVSIKRYISITALSTRIFHHMFT